MSAWVCVLLCACAQYAAGAQYMLPADVLPLHYDLTLLYDIDLATNFSFYGVADIKISVKNATSQIILHSKGYNISPGDIRITGKKSPNLAFMSINATYDYLILKFDKYLEKNNVYSLVIPFSGNLKHSLDGVYISSYMDKITKKKEFLICTQFEAIFARKGFPCFDEPSLKATFRMTLGHHRRYNANSNMPQISKSDQNPVEQLWPWKTVEKTFKKPKSQFVWERFDVSLPMSTYLVAFVISKFSYVENTEPGSKTMFRIWARNDVLTQTHYASVIGPKILSFFEDYFNVSFPLPKQDMVAIPDFAAGAMENWGLITYREISLLYCEQQVSLINKEKVALVIAHELAHQWFGNLVTMKWWSDLWLNEGFATYAASLGSTAIEPQSQIDNDINYMTAILELDALEASRPVVMALDDPLRIAEMFDKISYRKGSILIRMMNMFLGEKIFRKALHNYLIKYSYKNAEQADLWRELEGVAQRAGAALPAPPALPEPPAARAIVVSPAEPGSPADTATPAGLRTVMDTWTTQPGYPLLTVTRDYDADTLTVTQKRYLGLPGRWPSTSSWWVPLTVLCERDEVQAPPIWLAAGDGVRDPAQFKHTAATKDWVLFNYDMIALCRVNYDVRNWRLLAAALRRPSYSRIPMTARVQLLSDSFALAASGHIDYDIALDIVSYIRHEYEYLPLKTALVSLGKIEAILRRTPDYGIFQKFLRRLIATPYQSSGGSHTKIIKEPDNLTSVKIQIMMKTWACRMKVCGCEESAIELFQSWMDTSDPDAFNPIPIDLQRTVYCTAIGRGDVHQWQFALRRYQATDVATARLALLQGMSCSRIVWILYQFLEWTVTDESEVRRQDAAPVIMSITKTPAGFYVARDFIYNRIEDIARAFSSQPRSLGHIVKSLVEQFYLQEELDEFMSWANEHAEQLAAVTLATRSAVEAARLNIAWRNNNRHIVNKFHKFISDFNESEACASSHKMAVNYNIFIMFLFHVLFLVL